MVSSSCPSAAALSLVVSVGMQGKGPPLGAQLRSHPWKVVEVVEWEHRVSTNKYLHFRVFSDCLFLFAVFVA